jgi:outer membrane lipopolysaccharide assembly protein LptE/RlpB
MRCSLFVLILILLTGCGYRLAGESLTLPADVSILNVEMFENRTMEPYLENIMTKQVTRRLLLIPELKLIENQEKADAVISGKIVSYSVASSAYDRQNQVTQYRVTMSVEANLRRLSDGKILWRGNVVRFQYFSADPDLKRQDDLERIAQSLLSGRLAEDISSRLTDTF